VNSWASFSVLSTLIAWHRFHRTEELTCRSLSRPKDIAELCLAFEVEHRLP